MSQYPGGQQPPPPQDPYYGGPPNDPYGSQQPQDPYYGAPPPGDPYAQPPEADRGRGGSGAAIFGILLVIVGVWVLFGDQLDLDVDWSEIWPLLAVIVGAAMVLASLVPGRGRRDG